MGLHMDKSGAFVSEASILRQLTHPRRDAVRTSRRISYTPRFSMTSRSAPLKRVPTRRAFLQSLAAAVPLALISPALSEEVHAAAASPEASEELLDIDPGLDEPKITDRVYLDFTLDGGVPQRLTIGLYGGIVPQTVDNFKSLVRSGYVGTSVYRVVPGLTVQLGDVLQNGGRSGRAATEDGTLALENVRVKHSIPGLVSMVRGPEGLVDSRFFVNTRPGDSGYLDGRYCAFGRVMDNMEFLYKVERAAGKGAFVSRLPKVRIVDAGVLP